MVQRIMAGGVFAVLLLTACGGGSGSSNGSGGGSGSSSSSSSSSSPLSLSLSSTSGSAAVTEGGATVSLATKATVVGTLPPSAIPNLQYDASIFSSATAISNGSPGNYDVSLTTAANLTPGTYTGNVTFRLCQDASCTQVYVGSTITYAYSIKVNLKDWNNHQRDAGHTGFVNMIYDPARFTKIWEWMSPGYLFPMSTGNGLVYLSSNEAAEGNFDAKVYALKLSDGSAAWNYGIPGAQAISAPSNSGNEVFFTTSTNEGNSFFWTLDAQTGLLKNKNAIVLEGDYARLQLAPTFIASKAYIHAGISQGRTYGFSASGSQLWATNSASIMAASQSPAVDDASAYIYDGGLLAMNSATGALSYKIPDPEGTSSYFYGATPIIASDHSVIAPSGFGDNGSFVMEGNSRPRKLIRYNLTTRTISWTSTYLSGTPAVGNGVIYAGDNTTGELLALRESDGATLWRMKVPDDAPGSIILPATPASFHGNFVVTRNLVFFSTARKIYAVDLITHNIVWTYESPGLMAIAPGDILCIATAHFDYINAALVSNKKIVAVRLN